MTSGGAPVRRTVEVINQRGLHARVAARIAATAEDYDADIRISAKGQEVSADSIMGLLMLAASIGTKVELNATGAQAERAIDALAAVATACGSVWIFERQSATLQPAGR